MTAKRATSALMARTARKAYGTHKEQYAEWLQQRNANEFLAWQGVINIFLEIGKAIDNAEHDHDLKEAALMYDDHTYSH